MNRRLIGSFPCDSFRSFPLLAGNVVCRSSAAAKHGNSIQDKFASQAHRLGARISRDPADVRVGQPAALHEDALNSKPDCFIVEGQVLVAMLRAAQAVREMPVQPIGGAPAATLSRWRFTYLRKR